MVELSNIISSNKSISIEHSYLDWFVVDLEFIPRERMKRLVSKCSTTKFDKQTRQPTEALDDEKFLEQYTKVAIKGWQGLTIEHVSKLLPISVNEDTDMDEVVEYTPANAIQLMSNSSEFEQWVTSTMGAIENFNKVKVK